MEFQESCLEIAVKAWELKVDFPVILGFQYDRPVLIELPDDVDSEKRVLQFIHYIAEDEVWDALAIINEVWFDMVSFNKPFQLPSKNPDAQDGVAVALITRNRSYVSIAQVKNGELGKFAPWRIMAGGRYFDIKLGKKLKKAV